MATSLRDDVVRAVRDAGADAVGVASAAPFVEARRTIEERKRAGLHGGMHFTYRNPARSTDPGRSLEGARSLVVAARSYRRRAPDSSSGPAGTVARYAREDHYGHLRDALAEGAGVLEARGHRVRLLVDDNALVDRAAAIRAGIGWFGKNTNVLLPGLGSWFVLGSIVTDADLSPFDEPVDDSCGPCTACTPACPTGALEVPGVLDARRCLAWLLEATGDFPREHRVALGGRIYGCDECQEVCPPNRLIDRRDPPPAASERAEAWVDLVEILELSEDDILDRFGRWYIPGREPRYVRRNAIVALGNVGDATDPRVASAIDRMLRHPDPMLRRHAVWTAVALGLEEVARCAVDEDGDDSVVGEFQAAVGARPH